MNRRMSKAFVVKKMRIYLASLQDPSYASSKELIANNSWSRTTVLYLIKEVENTNADPALVVSEFIKMFDRRSGIMFRVAYDIAVDLYDHVFL